jgi:hypothetical protein
VAGHPLGLGKFGHPHTAGLGVAESPPMAKGVVWPPPKGHKKQKGFGLWGWFGHPYKPKPILFFFFFFFFVADPPLGIRGGQPPPRGWFNHLGFLFFFFFFKFFYFSF